ncbi:MAG: tRNA (adenosine(37)-N6)-dimethylallyltransferase MiaA [Marivibrio sp.]|uniref:tRNA (adenosine(37)-N6)-dimethylallyltransferase MiaA n=1 Tax=Marivibrio sp. TaxID=2039719 RepID=UPI0032EB9895
MPATPALVILGPTASGKSALALDAAEAFDGTIVNADSMQIYRELPLLTARPSAAEEARVPHRLYGVLGAGETCSAHRWRALAVAAMEEAAAVGRLPILAGGTGFYVKAMLEGLSPMPEVPDALREGLRARVERQGPEALHRELAEIDPPAAARIAPADRQRIARALEVYEASGRTLSSWQAEPPSGPPPGFAFTVIVLAPPREALVRRIEERFDAMIAAGALAELRALLAADPPADAPLLKAVGAPELAAAARGQMSLAEAAEAAKIATRQYAKRQTTWLKRQILPDLILNEQYSEKLMERVFAFIRDKRLTP